MNRIALIGPLLILVAVFCGVRAWRDFARGDTAWAVASAVALICTVVVLLIPIPTHAVKYDILP